MNRTLVARNGVTISDMTIQNPHAAPVADAPQHPGVAAYLEQRASSLQNRIADTVTTFAGSMLFVYAHIVLFAVWMILAEASPWPTLTLGVSLESIFLSTFVMIAQNRQAGFAQAKADHDFTAQELELKTNTQLTREIHRLTSELHKRVVTTQE
jgi:uncharacterized membrane protein